MESLPVELLWRIFCHACVDDGYTGRSLSRVSRYVRRAARGVMFQSVALRGPVQILDFASWVERRRDIARQVRYLLIILDREQIADRYSPPQCPRFKQRTRLQKILRVKPDPRADRVVLMERSWDEADRRDASEAIADIARAVAPTLQNLSVHAPLLHRDIPTIFSVDFPVLSDLTIHCTHHWGPRHFMSPLPPADKNTTVNLPALRRLHIIGRTFIPLQLLRVTNHLTHLRFSSFDTPIWGPALRAFKDRVWLISLGDADDALAALHDLGFGDATDRPDRLVRLVIQPCHFPRWHPHYRYRRRRMQGFMSAMRIFARKSENMGCSTDVVLNASGCSTDPASRYERLEKEWMDVNEGGDGDWDVEDEKAWWRSLMGRISR